MNKQIFLSTVFSIALLSLTACSNDDNKTTDDGQVNAAQAIEFKVDFADYNAEQDVNVTRAGNKEVKLEEQTVDLGNGILAQCTLQRDTTKQATPAATRALTDGLYTMLAYDAATHAYKGDITGTVTGGNTFTPTSANQDLVLTPGTYDFVLYNSKVIRSGNNLTVNRTDADAALIGRTQQVITVTPHKQQVPFTMKHVCAKVKIQLLGYMEFSGVTGRIESVNATDVPGSSIYDASTGTWTIGAGLSMFDFLTYGTAQESYLHNGLYSTISNEAVYFMPNTDVSKLKLKFGGHIYNTNMNNVSLTCNPAATLKLEQNGSYVLNVKLLYNFLYLMSDGTIGTIKDTTYGGAPAATAKTPIAVVLSQSMRMAIALKDANGGYLAAWTNGSSGGYLPNGGGYAWNQTNTHMYTSTNADDAFNTGGFGTSGFDETWDPSYTYYWVSGEKVKGKRADFPAFYAAAHYDPGVAYTGSPALQWYLPSAGDWTRLFSALGFGDGSTGFHLGTSYKWYGYIANLALTQVGGTKFSSYDYYSSSEYETFQAIRAKIESHQMSWGTFGNKGDDAYVRAFVKY